MTRKTVLIYAAITFVTLIAAEALARVCDWTPSNEDASVGDNLGDLRYEQSYSGFGDLMPNQDGHWVVWFHRPYHVQTNTAGLRNTEEPLPSAFRVLALGDSQTFGPYLANEDTWPAWTENALRRRVSMPDTVQVFNAGISSYSILDELTFLKEKGIAFHPQLVLLAVFENDVLDLRREHDGKVKRKVSRGVAPGLSKKLRSWFALAHVTRKIRRNIDFALQGVDVKRGEANPVGPSSPSAPQVDMDVEQLKRRYNELFDETAQLLQSQHIPFAVVSIPTAQEVAQEGATLMGPVIREATRRNGVPLLEVASALRSVPDAPTRLFLIQRDPKTGDFVGNGHSSREGNAVIGTAVAEWLLSQSLVRNDQLTSMAPRK